MSENNELKEVTGENINYKTADEKLDNEFKEFKGNGVKGAVAKPTLETLKLFCKNEKFAHAVMINPNTFTQCIEKIMVGVGNAISDLEVYQRAAAFYFPDAKISFQMTINTDDLEVPVMEKEINAHITRTEPNYQSNVVPITQAESKRITINLDELL